MFRSKKPRPGIPDASPVPRGRADSGGGDGDNPLARRLQSGGEPDTVDLMKKAAAGPPEPAAVDAASEGTGSSGVVPSGRLSSLVSRDPSTGKFYAHPGSAETPVFLGDDVVQSPTELRRGDRIRIGDAEFRFVPRQAG